MEKRATCGIMLTLIMISISMLTFTLTTVRASPETILYIEPSSIIDPTLTPGSTFTVDVMVSDVEYLYAWQVNMSFNPAVLKVVDIMEGDFLEGQPEGTFGAMKIENEKGWAFFGWTTKGAYIGVSGSGTFAMVEFQVLAVGESLIEIWHYPTCLTQQFSSYPPPSWNDLYPPEDFATQNGYFNNLGAVVVSSTLDIEPDTLNLESKGRLVKAYIELPEDYNVVDIDISTVKLNYDVSAELHPIEIGDYDKDGFPDLMVKFNRQDLVAILSVGEATLTITGEVNGIPFEGSDTIRVIGK